MRLNGICLITGDVGRLRAFYSMVLRVEASGDDGFCAMQVGGAELSIFGEAGMEQMAPGSMTSVGRGGFTLELEVSDPDAEHARLGALGVPVVKPPTTQPWGRRSVWFRDPDGNILNLYTNTRSRPSAGFAGTVRLYFDRLLNERDLAACDEFLSPEFRDHDAPDDAAAGPGPTKLFVQAFLRDYPDLKVQVLDTVESGDRRVAATVEWRGSHRDTGETLHQTGIVLVRLNDAGQLVERWSAYREEP